MIGSLKRKSTFAEPAPKKRSRSQFDAKLVRIDESEIEGKCPNEIVLTQTTFRVGRDPRSCAQVLDATDPRVPKLLISRNHAEFEFVGNRWKIRNLSQVNGTMLNNQKLSRDQSVEVINGATIIFGPKIDKNPFKYTFQLIDSGNSSKNAARNKRIAAHKGEARIAAEKIAAEARDTERRIAEATKKDLERQEKEKKELEGQVKKLLEEKERNEAEQRAKTEQDEAKMSELREKSKKELERKNQQIEAQKERARKIMEELNPDMIGT